MKQQLALIQTPTGRLFLGTSLALLALLAVVALVVLSAGFVDAQAQSGDKEDDDDSGSSGGSRSIIITIDPDDDFFDEEDWRDERDEDRDRRDEDDEWDLRDDENSAWGEALQQFELKREDLQELKEMERELERELRDRVVPDAPRPPRRPRVPDHSRDHYRNRIDINIDDDDGRIIRIGRNLRIREDEIVESAVVLFGNLIVEGEVEESAVVVGGLLSIGEDAVVNGDAVVIGGRLDIDRDGYVRGERVEFGNMGPLGMAFVIAPDGDRGAGMRKFISAFAILFVSLFLAWLVHLLVGDRLQTMAHTIQTGFWRSLLIGLVVSLLWLPVAILFAITVIGIPVFLVLILAAPLVAFIAYLAGAEALGRRVATGVRFERQSNLGYLMVGMIAIAALFLLANVMGLVGSLLIPIAFGFSTAGSILVALMISAGLGAMLTTRFGRKEPDAGVPSPGEPLASPAPELSETSVPPPPPAPPAQPESPGLPEFTAPPEPPAPPDPPAPTRPPES